MKDRILEKLAREVLSENVNTKNHRTYDRTEAMKIIDLTIEEIQAEIKRRIDKTFEDGITTNGSVVRINLRHELQSLSEWIGDKE